MHNQALHIEKLSQGMIEIPQSSEMFSEYPFDKNRFRDDYAMT